MSIYLSLIVSFIFILTIVLNIIDINKKRNLWEYGINLSMNYLEKIPKIVELALSTFLTVILGKTNITSYYTKEEYPNYQPKFLTYFTKMKNYENSDLIPNNMIDSLFTNELYDNYRIKKNIEFCENDEFFKGYFEKTKFWNKELNEHNNYCIKAAFGGILFFNKWINTLDTFLSYVDALAFSCEQENKNISEYGLDLEIDLILHELTYLYIEFEERIKNDISYISYARKQFFENKNFMRMLKDMNIPFTFGEGSLFSSTKEDLNQLNTYISNYEIIFIMITFVIDAIFLSFLIIMIIYNEKKKNILVFVGKILKKE